MALAMPMAATLLALIPPRLYRTLTCLYAIEADMPARRADAGEPTAALPVSIDDLYQHYSRHYLVMLPPSRR